MDERRPPDKKNEVLEVGGTAYVEDRDKANQFAKTYKQFSLIPITREDKEFRKQVRRKTQITTDDPSETDITMEELERVIDGAGLNKAAGADRIPYEFMKHYGPKMKEALLCLYNKCWNGQQLPPIWRLAIIK